MVEDRSVQSAHYQETDLALDTTEPPEIAYDLKPAPALDALDAKPTPELVDNSKPSALTALNSVNRQLAKVNAALTELRFASEREQTTELMLARINVEWDVLDERIKTLARAALDHVQWIRQPLEMVYGRLHKLLERGIVCRQEAGQEASDPRELLEQLGRLAQRVLINWDVAQRRRDEHTRGDDLTGRTLGGFVLRGRIGGGGHGEVYSCEQPLARTRGGRQGPAP